MTDRFPELGDDLAALVATLPGRLEQVRELTSLRSPWQRRASYKLTFSDGLVVKGRRFKDPERAARATALAILLRNLPFNHVLAARGDARLEEWVKGEPLPPAMPDAALAQWAGDLLGRLHAVAGFELIDSAAPPDAAWYLRGLQCNLDELESRGALAGDTARRLHDFAVATQPRASDNGLIHTDFCAENFIATDQGRIVVIDNEHLAVGSRDYDVVRCWCRWPMSESARRAFRDGYTRHRGLDVVFDHLGFWALYSLAQSARVRSRHGAVAQPQLDALARLARGDIEHPWPNWSATRDTIGSIADGTCRGPAANID